MASSRGSTASRPALPTSAPRPASSCRASPPRRGPQPMTALQPLTDAQVNNRLDVYNEGGALERDIRALWDAAGEIIEGEVLAQYDDEAAKRVRAHYTSPVDGAWIQSVAEYGRRIYHNKTSVPAYIAKRDKLISAIIGKFFDKFAEDPEALRACVTSFQRL